jgi:hypothetical protein
VVRPAADVAFVDAAIAWIMLAVADMDPSIADPPMISVRTSASQGAKARSSKRAGKAACWWYGGIELVKIKEDSDGRCSVDRVASLEARVLDKLWRCLHEAVLRFRKICWRSRP